MPPLRSGTSISRRTGLCNSPCDRRRRDTSESTPRPGPGLEGACLALLLLLLPLPAVVEAAQHPDFHQYDNYRFPDRENGCTTELPLRLWAFRTWMQYFEWRSSISPECARRQPIQPCVLSNGTWACLPKLVVIGPMKGGTTGLRAKLTATGHFYTKVRRGQYVEGHLWDKQFAMYGSWVSNTQLAEFWARELMPNFNISWHEMVDEEGYAKKLAIEMTPSYLMNLVASDVQRMLEVNPDVHFLMLARDPADAFLSAREMSICRLGVAPNTTCGTLGCDSWISLYPALPPEGPERDACRPEEIPCEGFAEAIRIMLRDGIRKVRKHDDPESGYLRFDKGDNGANVSRFYGQHDRWRYAYFLHQEWMRVVPQPQLHVLQSDYLWEEPDNALGDIRRFLHLPFEIESVDGTRTKPDRQLKCGCADSDDNVQSLHAVIERCRLKDAVRCAYVHANSIFSTMMTETFREWSKSPVIDWNRGLTHKACEELGFFTDSPDLYYTNHSADLVEEQAIGDERIGDIAAKAAAAIAWTSSLEL